MGPWARTRGGSRERGSTFVMTLVLVFATLALTLSALFGVRSGMLVFRNYQTGLAALLAAEAGAVHAQNRIDGFGVVRFDTDVVDRWDEVFGSTSRSIPGHSSIRYVVTPEDDPVDPSRFVLLTAVGSAPNEAQRRVRVRLRKTRGAAPGAIYLLSEGVQTTFNGNQFLIDGNDRRLNGTPGSSEPVPGIGTTTDSTTEDVIDSLSEPQEDNVIGYAGEPSVETATGITATRLQNDVIPAILSQPGVVTNPTLTGNDVFGTIAVPRITHFTGSVTINGNLTGAGVLIVDQGLTISGSADFTGLIIVRGATEITIVSGNATILGSLWTTDLSLNVSGSASVTYSSEALELANGIDAAGELLPERAVAVGWAEM